MSADFLTTQKSISHRPAPARPVLTTLERAMLVIVGLGLAASCFVISSRQYTEAGHRPWQAGSVLQPITQLMSLNFEYPTRRGTEIKWLAQGLAAAAALMAAVIGWYVWSRPGDPQVLPAGMPPPRSLRDRIRLFFTSASPASAAQIAIMLFAGWTFLSAWWSPWPVGSLGEAARQLMPIVWAVVLGRTLSARGARTAAVILVSVLTLTAVIGIWYYYERNPVQRLKFPIGNPIFLAACLLPGLILPLAWLGGWIAGVVRNGGKDCPAGECEKGFSHQQQTEEAPDSTQIPSAPHARNNPRCERISPWLALAAVPCFAFVAWAFVLAGSRGPLVGLALGLVTVAYFILPKLLRWMMVGLVVAGLIYAAVYVSGHLNQEGSRWATARFRTYAWSYALDMFFQRPMGGVGQGGYLMLAQGQSIEDAVNDPAAFPAELLGHAHNEWLEILADLGAAGLALISTALGVTFWAAGLALRKLTGRADRWCLLGLVGTLVALIVEEMTDVALRTPVFPLIFYTVVGLIWALCASTERSAAPAVVHGHSRGVRVLGLLLGGGAALVLAWLAINDWQGARAQFKVGELAERQDWDGALAHAAIGRRMRLGIEDRLVATEQAGNVAGEAARSWFNELHEIVAPAEQGHPLSGPSVQLAAEAAAHFDRYFDASMEAGEAVLQHMPYFPYVASNRAELMLLKGDKERVEQFLGLRKDASVYHAEARRLLSYELTRDPYDPELSLRLLEFTGQGEPLDARLNLLRVPLRDGPVHPAVPRALAELSQDPNFRAVVNDWMALARATVNKPGQPWADAYAPETLRLVAMLNELQRSTLGRTALPADPAEQLEQAEMARQLAGESAAMAADAADLLLTVRAYFPNAAAYARADQARYTLWAVPESPETALAVYRQALSEWRPHGSESAADLFREELATYQLATGREDQARATIRDLFPGAADAIIDARLAGHLERLAQWFMLMPPPARLVHFDEFVQHLLELTPDSPSAHLMAAQLAFEAGNDAAGMSHLERIDQLGDPQRLAQAVAFLAGRFPNNQPLRLLAGRLFQQAPSNTQPAGPATQSTNPSTQPAHSL